VLEEINAHGLTRYPEAVAEGLIEPGIRPLTDALYESGAHPLASCEGHALNTGRPGRGWLRKALGLLPAPSPLSSPPYAMFSASESFARCLQRECDRQRQALFYNWWLRAHFVPGEYALAWTIQLNDIRSGARSFDFTRAHQDIRQLAVIARHAATQAAVLLTTR